MPLPLTVSCSSKIQIGFTFLVPAHPGSPGKRAVKRVCVCVCLIIILELSKFYLLSCDTASQMTAQAMTINAVNEKIVTQYLTLQGSNQRQ